MNKRTFVLKVASVIILMTIKMEDVHFHNLLLDGKSFEDIFIYDALYKTLIGAKTLHIMFEKVGGLIRDYDGTKYLVLFEPEKYDTIIDRIRYLSSRIKKQYYIYCFS